MKHLEIYAANNLNSADSVFCHLISTLTDSILVWDYFVNWTKVFGNIKEIEVHLNTLNYLIGKEDVHSELKYLIEQSPGIIGAIPVLIACRTKKLIVNEVAGTGELVSLTYDFTNRALSNEEIDKAVYFLDKSGFLTLIKDRRIKSIPDYVIGVEVGLDTNGRKNRSGSTMEGITDTLIKSICENRGYEYLTQANRSKIFSKWGIQVEALESDKSFDFAIKTPSKLHIVETNYYSGTGSKLKSTAGEYISYNNTLLSQGINFIWVTDGKGWVATQRPLKDTFDNNNYILNLEFIKSGILEEILSLE